MYYYAVKMQLPKVGPTFFKFLKKAESQHLPAGLQISPVQTASSMKDTEMELDIFYPCRPHQEKKKEKERKKE